MLTLISNGKSIDTALYDIVGCTERGLAVKEYRLGIFLDIEGASNNILSVLVIYGSSRAHTESRRVSSKEQDYLRRDTRRSRQQTHKKRHPSRNLFSKHEKKNTGQAAIRSLQCNSTSSKGGINCRNSLDILSTKYLST